MKQIQGERTVQKNKTDCLTSSMVEAGEPEVREALVIVETRQHQQSPNTMFSYKFYDNLSIVSLGSLVICGVGGAAVWLGVAASGGIAAHAGDSWDQENGLTWLTLSSCGTLVSLILLFWSCAGKHAHTRLARHNKEGRQV